MCDCVGLASLRHFAVHRSRLLDVVCALAAAAPPLIGGVHEAAERGDAERVQSLIRLGANPDVPSVRREARTPLHSAAEAGRGDAPLHLAAKNGWEDVVATVLARGASALAADEHGWTALHMAAAFGHAGSAQRLLEAGADPDARTSSGRTALHLAMESGEKETIETLLRGGADPDRVDFMGRRPDELAPIARAGVGEYAATGGMDLASGHLTPGSSS